MYKFLLPTMLGFTAAPPQPAVAQDASFYNCQNERVRIAISQMPLDKALAEFTRVTRCPVSIDTDRVGGRRTQAMKTASIKGRLTPEQALARMLRATPLKYTPIHGGFSVGR